MTMEEKKQKFVIIDGKRYLVSSRSRSAKIAELAREMEARKRKIREEMEVLGSDHAKITSLYVTPEQMVMYAEMGLWQCKFCEEGFMGHLDYCPKCGCGPKDKPRLGPTVDMIAAVIGRWKPKKMSKEAKEVLKNQE